MAKCGELIRPEVKLAIAVAVELTAALKTIAIAVTMKSLGMNESMHKPRCSLWVAWPCSTRSVRVCRSSWSAAAHA